MEEGEREGQREGSGSVAEIQQLWPFAVSWERLEAEQVQSPSISTTDSSSSLGALPGPGLSSTQSKAADERGIQCSAVLVLASRKREVNST